YRQMNEGTLTGHVLREGELVATGWRRLLQLARLPFKPGLRQHMLHIALLATGTTALATWFAVNGGIPQGYRGAVLGMLTVGITAIFSYGWVIARQILRPLEGIADIAR